MLSKGQKDALIRLARKDTGDEHLNQMVRAVICEKFALTNSEISASVIEAIPEGVSYALPRFIR